MSYEADPRVDAYIDVLPEWEQDICREIRDLVHEADAEVAETIKRSVQPYFVLDGNVCALLAAKDHVNVFLYDGAMVPDPEGIITDGHDNKTARTVAIRQGRTWRRSHLLATTDLVVAATAQEFGAHLATSNIKHFPMFDGLVPPYDP